MIDKLTMLYYPYSCSRYKRTERAMEISALNDQILALY